MPTTRAGNPSMISGRTTVIAHLGYPTEAFKAPLIYNPYFEKAGIDAVVVPMGVTAADYGAFLRPLFRVSNVHGALVKRPDGTLFGDMFDGTGFVHGVERKGRAVAGTRALVVGAGGVGSAIAASLAAAGACVLGLFDIAPANADALALRLRAHYPRLDVRTGSSDPSGFDIVVNATPLGMQDGDALPLDVARIAPGTFVGEVVMKEAFTPFLRAALARGCPVQVGTDMLYEMIPAYLRFFGFATTTPESLRELAAEPEGET
jgi:shikimate dehydrogenase